MKGLLSALAIVLTTSFVSCNTAPEPTPTPEKPEPTLDTPLPEGSLILTGLQLQRLNTLASHVTYTLSNSNFDLESNNVQLTLNKKAVDIPISQVAATNINADIVLNDGKNELKLKAYDSLGRPVYSSHTFWAGQNELDVNIVDDQGKPYLQPTEINLNLSDDASIGLSASTSSGVAHFSGVPGRTVVVTAKGINQAIGIGGGVGNAGTIVVQMLKTVPVSAIQNNDFSQNLTGWDVNPNVATIVEHEENVGPNKAKPLGLVPHMDRSRGAIPSHLSAAAVGDPDLLLTTSGEGPQSLARTFNVTLGTTSVEMRYRFITSEVPGGYFGSKYNDYYNVALRSGKSDVSTESNTMNGLGLSAFDAGGSTAWRTVKISTNPKGDMIFVNAVVANVADAKLDSQVAVDYVKELKDQIKSELSWNTSAGGLNLKITVEGEKLENEAKVEVYWASGTSSGSKLGSPIFTKTLPAGTAAGTQTESIAGSELSKAPAGTTHIISVANDSDVNALQDVSVGYGANANADVVSAGMIDAIKASLRAAGQAQATITSTARTPEDQARAMFNNLVNSARTIEQNVQNQNALYGAAGRAVVATFVSQTTGQTRDQIIANSTAVQAAMVQTINAQGPSNVSRHCGDPAVLSVVDVGASAFGSNISLFISAARALVTTLLDERSTNSAIHLELAN